MNTPIKYGIEELDLALAGYKKDTPGSDVWKPSEFRKLQTISRQFSANVIGKSLNAAVVPHQNLCSLNALLGKPNGTCRTVCETPVLYRMALRTNKLGGRIWSYFGILLGIGKERKLGKHLPTNGQTISNKWANNFRQILVEDLGSPRWKLFAQFWGKQFHHGMTQHQ